MVEAAGDNDETSVLFFGRRHGDYSFWRLVAVSPACAVQGTTDVTFDEHAIAPDRGYARAR